MSLGAGSRLSHDALPHVRLLLVLLLVAGVSAGARLLLDSWLTLSDGRQVVFDADSQYQLRRVERMRSEGWLPADSDPWMVWPDGAGIQWPPGYPLLCGALLLPFAPEGGTPSSDALARAWLERSMGVLPLIFGVLGSVLAAWAARRLAGDLAGLVAGLLHALSLPSIGYSGAGNADYHGFVGACAGALPVLLSAALAGGVLAAPRRAAGRGAVAGLLAGVLWASWLGTIHHVLTFDLMLLLLLLRDREGRLGGLGAFGAAFHLAALPLVIPLVASSPWLATRSWSVEFMTQSQPALLLLGAAFWLPLALVPALRDASRARRRYPLLAAGALLLLGSALVSSDSSVARGVLAGLSSAVGEGAFAEIQESLPLLGERAGPEAYLSVLGWAGVALPLAWVAALLSLLRRRAEMLLPWIVAVPVLWGLAILQRRFANELALPLAVLLGWGVGQLLGAGLPGRVLPLAREPRAVRDRSPSRPRSAWLRGLAGLLLALLLQASTVEQLLDELAGRSLPRFPERRLAGYRELYEWLGGHAPHPPEGAVLASWGHGNGLLWVARQPIVATQFAYYVGAESRLAPSRVLLAESPEEARAILQRFDVRYLLLTPADPALVGDLARMLDPALEARLVGSDRGGAPVLTGAWRGTEQARLLLGMGLIASSVADAPSPPDDLRLLHVSPVELRGGPVGWIVERVAGALLERAGAGADELRVEVDLSYPGRDEPLRFRAEGHAGPDRVARVRVPYATTSPNGEGRAAGPLRWSAGTRTGLVAVSEADVRQGNVLVLDE